MKDLTVVVAFIVTVSVCFSYNYKDKSVDEQIKTTLKRIYQEFRHGEYVDPNSRFMELAESFQVLRDGQILLANDIHPEDGFKAKAEKQDKHMLTHQQKVELGLESEKPGEGHGIVSQRAFMVGNNLWPRGIVPYEINTTSLKFNETTCIQWLPHTKALEEELGHTGWVNFISSGGCWSYVGNVFSGQSLSLGQPGCLWVGVAIHEMGHALGEWHEQSRTDRDNHLNMRWDILGESTKGDANYGKMDSRNYNPYDYESVMQYGAGSGMEVLQPELKFLTDYGSDLSYYDIKDITDAYRCTDKCVNPPNCQNGGFLNFQCICKCPEGLVGDICESVINEKVCGGIVDIKPGEETTITTPNYPDSYKLDTKCVWLLRAPENLHVRVNVDVFHLPVVNNNKCYHWLEVGITWKCGTTAGDVWTTSSWGEQNLMLLIFDSVYGKNHPADKGFSLRASTVDKGCIPDPCINGVCKDCEGGKFRCQCDPGFEGTLCDTMEASAQLECSFERSSKCFLRNTKEDDFDWIIYSIRIGAERGSNWESDIALDDIKLSPGLCEDPKPLDCIASIKGTDYTGNVNTTVGGLTCQRWDSNSPNKHSYHDYDDHENYCRNIRGDENMVWCYTTDPSTSWDYCNVQRCDVEECIRSQNGYDYMGTKRTTEQGLTCKDGTFCTASANSPAPYCYVDDPDTRWDSCIIPKCSGQQIGSNIMVIVKVDIFDFKATQPDECIKTSLGKDYFGKVSTTKSGKTCQAWSKQEPHKHGFWAMNDESNYCRNPDGEPAPWCYTTDSDKRYEMCDIPFCQDLACRSNPCEHKGICEEVAGGFKCTCPYGYTGDTCSTRVKNMEDCRRSTSGSEYQGMINTTISNRTCQRWDLDTPHDHNYNNVNAENYCRNPDNEPAPWCYTTDPDKRWEVCDIPFCTTPAQECVSSLYGEDYFGTVRQTKNGIPCQKWSELTPHSHSYNKKLKDQDNYCRNPTAPGDNFPWCYTIDPDVRWDFCDIPRC
ncbi:PLG [Mytilus coruscus]|uniref:Metalloendopeptidase n=1 Tax=Mytilus coruscus TaxID=42192 RepID=A0A6J8AZB0_MYTCO|nr:PLG [Mytilus coruscus]